MQQGMSYEDALKALAAAEGIEYIDCRVQPGWGDDRPVRHDLPREVGHSPRHEVGAAGPDLGSVTAGTGLGDNVPVPVPLLLQSAYEQLMLDPRHREAAARGMKVHEDALALAKEQAIPYDDAIQLVLDDA